MKYSVILSNGRYQGWCLWGLGWQTFTDYELLFVDWDAEEPPALTGWPNARVLRWPERGKPWNHSVCRNFAVAHAQADRLVFVNCDCLMHPGLLAEADRLLDENPRRQVYWQRFDLTEAGLAQLGRLDDAQKLFDEADQWVAQGWGEFHPLGTYGDFLAVDRAAFESLGGYDERMEGWGVYDHNLACRLDRHGYPVSWHQGLRLVHLWHGRDKAAQDRTWRANIDAGEADFLAGEHDPSRDILNQGPATFEKYRGMA